MSRPLIVIFLTVFVNLVGFGIIIPLLPFYAQTFGASPLVIGLLFASFSLSQLLATPALGVLSDRWGRRPVLIFSLLGTVVSFAMLASRLANYPMQERVTTFACLVCAVSHTTQEARRPDEQKNAGQIDKCGTPRRYCPLQRPTAQRNRSAA